jgi:hypothetical protein
VENSRLESVLSQACYFLLDPQRNYYGIILSGNSTKNIEFAELLKSKLNEVGNSGKLINFGVSCESYFPLILPEKKSISEWRPINGFNYFDILKRAQESKSLLITYDCKKILNEKIMPNGFYSIDLDWVYSSK